MKIRCEINLKNKLNKSGNNLRPWEKKIRKRITYICGFNRAKIRCEIKLKYKLNKSGNNLRLWEKNKKKYIYMRF